MPKLVVEILGARNLHDSQTIGSPDPYVKIRFENNQFKTTAASNTTNPEWNQTFKFNVADEHSAQLEFEIWNSNIVSDDFLGKYQLSLSGLVRGRKQDAWYLLQQSKSNAEIHIALLAEDFGILPEDGPSEHEVAPYHMPSPEIPAPPSAVVYHPTGGPDSIPNRPTRPSARPTRPGGGRGHGRGRLHRINRLQHQRISRLQSHRIDMMPSPPESESDWSMSSGMTGWTDPCSRPECPYREHSTQGHGYCCNNCKNGRPHGCFCEREPFFSSDDEWD